MDLSGVERIFLGDESWTFLLEIFFRTTFLYVFTFLIIRLMSRRAVASLSFVELLLIVALGSAVGDPMFYPDVPLTHGMTVIATIVILNRGFSQLVSHSQRAERLFEGSPLRLVHEGRLDLDGLTRAELGRDELFELLRVAGIEHLGEVRVAYLELNGELSLFRFPDGSEQPGFPVEPPEEIQPMPRYESGDRVTEAGHYACWQCGATTEVVEQAPLPPCPYGHGSWVNARVTVGSSE